jgi:hypothetical protein
VCRFDLSTEVLNKVAKVLGLEDVNGLPIHEEAKTAVGAVNTITI